MTKTKKNRGGMAGGKPSENGGGGPGGILKGRVGPKNDTKGARGANIGLMNQQKGGGRGEGASGRGRGEGGRGGGRGRGEGGRGRGEGGRGRGGGRGGWGEKERIREKLRQLEGPMTDLPPREEKERKFSNHCRLWVGNLPLNIEEDDVKKLFEPYGEFDDAYFDKSKGFAFLRMDYKVNAEKARSELHMKDYKGRQLRIRFSPPGSALKVRNLSPLVSNELLEISFGVFGEIEKAVVLVDERGRSTGEGIVEYCKKPHAQLAARKCQEGCFMINSSPRPVVVELMAVVDESEGLSEVNIYKRNPQYHKERQDGPHFANQGSFAYEYGTKWKQLYELFDKKKEALDKELQDEKNKLEEQMEYARYEHETEMLRKQLLQREMYGERNKPDFDARQREWEEHRRMETERARREEEELTLRYRQQEEELRRRQEENRLFMQSSYQRAGDSWGGGISSVQVESDNEFEERPTTDLRKLLAERGRPKKEESEAGGTGENDLRKLLGRGRGKKL